MVACNWCCLCLSWQRRSQGCLSHLWSLCNHFHVHVWFILLSFCRKKINVRFAGSMPFPTVNLTEKLTLPDVLVSEEPKFGFSSAPSSDLVPWSVLPGFSLANTSQEVTWFFRWKYSDSNDFPFLKPTRIPLIQPTPILESPFFCKICAFLLRLSSTNSADPRIFGAKAYLKEYTALSSCKSCFIHHMDPDHFGMLRNCW